MRKLNDHLDIFRLPLERACEFRWWLAPRDEAPEPRAVCTSQHFSRLVPVPLVGVDTPNHDVVAEHDVLGAVLDHDLGVDLIVFEDGPLRAVLRVTDAVAVAHRLGNSQCQRHIV